MKYTKPRAKLNDIVIRVFDSGSFTQEEVNNAGTNSKGVWIYNEGILEGEFDNSFNDDEIVENLTTGNKYV